MFAGSLVALVTPMQPDGSIDFDAWSRLLEFHVANGTTGIVVAGSTGESATVTDGELRELLVRARAYARQARIAHRQRGHQQHRHVGRARALRFPSWMSTPCWSSSPSTCARRRRVCSCISKHRRELPRVPVMLYNVPSRTAVDLLPATVARLSRLPRIAGIKEAVGEAARVRELVASCAAELQSAERRRSRPRGMPSVSAPPGVISVTANVAPRAMADMVGRRRARRSRRRHADRSAPGGPASQPVRRVESDPGQMGGGAHGAHGRHAAPAADRAVGRSTMPSSSNPCSPPASAV